MRRALPILIAVFVGLCALGLWLTRERPVTQAPSPSTGTGPGERERASSAPPPPAPSRPPSAVNAPIAATTPSDAGPPAHAPSDEELLAARPPAPAPLVGGNASPPAGPEEAGSLDRAAIKAAIESVKPLIRQCFEDAQEKFPPPQKVTLSFTVVGQGISGHFDEGTIQDSTITDPWVQACFLDALTDAHFPVPQGGGKVTVTYPFVFGRNPPDAGG